MSSFSAGPYLLQSEMRTNFGEISTSARLTTYSYDNNGNVAKKLLFSGGDTVSGINVKVIYGFNLNRRLVSEVQLKTGVDTISEVYYSYDVNGNVDEIRTMVNSSGNWQIDSLKYDSNQRLIEKWHFAAITYYRHYSYNDYGQEIADTLYERGSTAFAPTQASIFDYTASNATTQKDYSVTGGIWYLKQSTITKFLNNHIMSTAVYEQNGVSQVLVDSLSYTYDSFGNKSQVSHFDNTGARIYSIDYQWMPNPYDAILVRGAPEKKNIEIAYSKRMVTVRHSESAAGYLAVFALDGKLIKKETILAGQNCSMALPGIGRGKFVAVYMAGGLKQSLLFNSAN